MSEHLCSPVRPERLRFDDGRHRVFNAPLNSFFNFVDVFDVALENQKIRSRTAINLERAAIVPFDCSFNLFTVLQDQNHRRVRVDLFLVIVNLGMRLRRRRLSFSDLNRRRLRRRTRRWHSTAGSAASIGSIVSSITLLCGLSPGLNVCQRRPD